MQKKEGQRCIGRQGDSVLQVSIPCPYSLEQTLLVPPNPPTTKWWAYRWRIFGAFILHDTHPVVDAAARNVHRSNKKEQTLRGVPT